LRDEIADAGVQMGVSRSSRGDKAPRMRTPRFDQPPGQPPSLRWNSVGFPLVRSRTTIIVRRRTQYDDRQPSGVAALCELPESRTICSFCCSPGFPQRG
jgi:hypothetical protein